MPEFRLKRVYQKAHLDDGTRILVDRLWPRGISKDDAQFDRWAKVLTPSHELRQWFHKHADQHADFAHKYRLELEERIEEIKSFFDSLKSPTVTLVTSTKDMDRGHAAVLKSFLVARLN